MLHFNLAVSLLIANILFLVANKAVSRKVIMIFFLLMLFPLSISRISLEFTSFLLTGPRYSGIYVTIFPDPQSKGSFNVIKHRIYILFRCFIV